MWVCSRRLLLIDGASAISGVTRLLCVPRSHPLASTRWRIDRYGQLCMQPLITVNYRLTKVLGRQSERDKETYWANGGHNGVCLCAQQLSADAEARASTRKNLKSTWLIHNYCCSQRIVIRNEQPWLVIKSGFKANKQSTTADHTTLRADAPLIEWSITAALASFTGLQIAELEVSSELRRRLPEWGGRVHGVDWLRVHCSSKCSQWCAIRQTAVIGIFQPLSGSSLVYKLFAFLSFLCARLKADRSSDQDSDCFFAIATGANRGKAGGTPLCLLPAQLMACAVTHGRSQPLLLLASTRALSTQSLSQVSFFFAGQQKASLNQR